MTVPSPREVVQQWVDAWNARDPEAVAALATPDFVRHDANSPDLVGPEAEVQLVEAVWAAFPDLYFTVNHVVAEGDFVADHLTGTGAHQGEFLGVPPTGRTVRFETMETYRVTDGRVAEQWSSRTCWGSSSSSVSFRLPASQRTADRRRQVAAGGWCTDQPLPSGSVKKQKLPHG